MLHDREDYMQLTFASINKVLLEHGPPHLFTSLCVSVLVFMPREQSCIVLADPGLQNLKHLSFVPLQEKFADSYSR